MPESATRLDVLRATLDTIGQSRPLRVLIVEDEKDEQELMRIELAQYPLLVDLAGSGEEALKALTNNKYDLIFLDVKLPGMDGIATFAEIKKGWPNSRVFFITGYPDFPGLNAALEKGVLRVILKDGMSVAFRELFSPCKTLK